MDWTVDYGLFTRLPLITTFTMFVARFRTFVSQIANSLGTC